MIRQQHKAMIPEVAHLIEDFLAHVILRGDDRFDGLLTDLLKDLILPLVEKVIGVRALNRIHAAILNDIVKFVEDDCERLLLFRRYDGNALLIRFRMQATAAEARISPRVAGNTALMDAHEQRIAIAVVGDLLDLLDIAGLLPFLPKALATAAVEPCQPRLNRLFQGLFVHIGKHEYLSALLLNDGRHEPLLVKMDF